MPYKKRARYTRKNKKKLGIYVRRIVQNIAETKEVSAQFSVAGVNTTWGFGSFLARAAGPVVKVEQGTGVNQRIGNKIRLKSIEFFFQIYPAAAAAAHKTGSTCRVIAWKQTACNGANPTAADHLTYDGLLAGVSINKQKEFQIIRDMQHSIVQYHGAAGTESMGPAAVYKWLIYPKDSEQLIEYSSTTGAIAEVVNRNWGYAFVADDASCCMFLGAMKIRYTDV